MFKPYCEQCQSWHTEKEGHFVKCETCGQNKRRDCDGKGWLDALGPYCDGSYITSRPCSNN
jgi:hypothetical protein